MLSFKYLQVNAGGFQLPFKRGLIVSIALVTVFFNSCVDPVKPEFNYQENVIFIDAYAVTQEGQSTVKITRSLVENGRFKMEGVAAAVVKLYNTVSGAEIALQEEESGLYICPSDFAVQGGETWELLIELSDGRRYESTPETVTPSIPIDNVSAFYSAELVYHDSYKKFVPGHGVSIDWTDPAGQENYYLWKYRSFETQDVCYTCYEGRLRDGICVDLPATGWFPPQFDYLCETPCWMIRYGEEIQIFDDRLSDGSTITSHHIANIPYYRSRNISVEIQQYSLTKSAYDYFKVVDDILNESSGLNAPPPVALLGNLFNPEDSDELVLGQFTATAVSIKSVYINRSNILEPSLSRDPSARLEPCPAGQECFRYAPCTEGRYRTAIKPQAWP